MRADRQEFLFPLGNVGLRSQLWCQSRRLTALLLAEAVAQVFPKTAVRAEEAEAHGDAGDAEARRDFVRGILQHITQQANLTEIGCESGDRSGHDPAHFLARISFLWIVYARG